jgi:hypothetical protein
MVLPICYRDIVQVGDTSTNYQMAPGDRIFVPTRSFCEELVPHKQDCPPCGGPQIPCTALPSLSGHVSTESGPMTLVKPAAPFGPDSPAPRISSTNLPTTK